MNTRTRETTDPPILLVEDKDSLRAMLRHALEAQGHTVVEARDQPEAAAALQTVRPAMVLSDLRLPEGDGFGVLRLAKELDPELPVVVMTAFGNVQDAVSAMKEGRARLSRQAGRPGSPPAARRARARAAAPRHRELSSQGGACAAPRRAADHRRGSASEAGIADAPARRIHRHDGV